MRQRNRETEKERNSQKADSMGREMSRSGEDKGKGIEKLERGLWRDK